MKRFHALLTLSIFVCTLAGSAQAADLEDLLVDLFQPFSKGNVSRPWTCKFSNLCDLDSSIPTPQLFLAGGALELSPLSDFTFSIVNDRIVPLSSSVTGFTYEYNEDLDVYERSSSTFGPLFSERAQTIGRGRFLVGLSHSTFEFDEFNGTGLDNISVGDLSGFLSVGTSSAGGLAVENVLQDAGLLSVSRVDVNFDLEIKQSVSTVYFTYGITDRIDLGLVVPFLNIDMKATAIPFVKGQPASQIPACDTLPPADTATDCVIDPLLATPRRDSSSFSGIGDLVLRGKWHFLTGRTNAAMLVSGTIPTGDPGNLTGFDDPTITPGLVVSRDFETPIGGFGVQGFAGYEVRLDNSDKDEFEWGVGVSFQPFGRTSLNLDLLGTEETSGDNFSVLDLSVGFKLMLTEGVLLDFNFITPLNDEGLRATSGILSAQLEWVFGD